ncbi:hypothetical protein AOLI_G00232190 [Acnodon oligacanthus]
MSPERVFADSNGEGRRKRCCRHRSRVSPSTSSSATESDKGRVGRGPSSGSGGLISRKKSSRKRRFGLSPCPSSDVHQSPCVGQYSSPEESTHE